MLATSAVGTSACYGAVALALLVDHGVVALGLFRCPAPGAALAAFVVQTAPDAAAAVFDGDLVFALVPSAPHADIAAALA